MLNTQTPAVAVIRSRTHDISDAHTCLNHIIGPHELVDLNLYEPLDFSFDGSQIGRMIIGDLIYGKDIIFKTKNHDDMDHYCITRPKVGQPIFKKDGTYFQSSYSNATIVSPYDKFEIQIKKDCVQNFMSFSKSFVEYVLSDLIEQPLHQPLYFQNTMFGDDKKIATWWNLIDSIVNFSNNFQSGTFLEQMKTDFEYVIVKSLLLSQPNNYSDLIHSKYHRHPDYLNRALDYIKKNIQHKIELDDLEKAVGVSRKKLSLGFKEYLKSTPNAYIRFYRLKCIYDEISCATQKINITEIAFKWGVTHLGRFSIEYKEAFNESPSDTLKKALQKLPAASVLIH